MQLSDTALVGVDTDVEIPILMCLVVGIPSISAVVIDPGAVTDPGLEIGPGAETDLVLEAEDLVQEADPVLEAEDLVQGHDQVREQDQVQDQAQAPDQVQDKGQVRWIDRGHHLVQDRVQAGKVPLVANGIVEDLHQGTVNVVRPVVPANQDQEHHGVQRAGAGVAADPRAAVVVDVAEEVEVEVAVVDADVDLK